LRAAFFAQNRIVPEMNAPPINRRKYWVEVAESLARPVLTHLAGRTLRARMPVEMQPGSDRRNCSHLEAFGRLMAGLSPWLARPEPAALSLAKLAREALDAATDPASPDCCNFTEGGQPLVDAAFLAQGLLRAPETLWQPLDPRVQRNILEALRATRAIRPPPSNWILFSAMVETALLVFGGLDWDRAPIDHALRQHEEWYKGDGFYGDGPSLHADYYNSFVISPMLVDIVRQVREYEAWAQLEERIWTRARRQAAVLERMISPEGTFPPLGRSLAYRFGAMQALAQMALLKSLPEGVGPAQAREALHAVMRRMIEMPGTFDADGWLRIGFCGSQPGLGEPYISTGSLYLCSVGLLPLGLPAEDPFWADPPAPWTAVKAWGGQETPIDHAISS
jgi:hypothetical protein